MLVALSKRFNDWLGPFLLKNGLKARCFLSGGGPAGGVIVQDSVLLDTLVGLQLAKRLVTLHVREAADRAVANATTDGTDLRSSFWKFWLKTTSPVSTATVEKTSPTSPSRSSPGSSGRTIDTLRPDEEGYLRLSVFEKCIRPALLPNEKWSDVQKWQFDKRLIQWIRQEYIYAAHIARVRAAFVVYPKLSDVQQLAPKRLALPRLLTGKLPFDNPFTTRTMEHCLGC
jgi:hypothetical protein